MKKNYWWSELKRQRERNDWEFLYGWNWKGSSRRERKRNPKSFLLPVFAIHLFLCVMYVFTVEKVENDIILICQICIYYHYFLVVVYLLPFFKLNRNCASSSLFSASHMRYIAEKSVKNKWLVVGLALFLWLLLEYFSFSLFSCLHSNPKWVRGLDKNSLNILHNIIYQWFDAIRRDLFDVSYSSSFSCFMRT